MYSNSEIKKMANYNLLTSEIYHLEDELLYAKNNNGSKAHINSLQERITTKKQKQKELQKEYFEIISK